MVTKERGLSVTVKHGKGYEDSWEVFSGSPAEIREDMLSFYGIDAGDVSMLTTHELVAVISAQVHSEDVGDIFARLSGEAAPQTAVKVSDELTKARPVVEPQDELIAAIQDAKTNEELDALWEPNKHLFDARVIAAATARRAEIEAK